MDIPFIPDALSWEAGGDPSEISWWDGGSFHANLANSTGLSPQTRRYNEGPRDLQETMLWGYPMAQFYQNGAIIALRIGAVLETAP